MGSVDEVASPRPLSTRGETGGDTMYTGVMRDTALKSVVTRLASLEESQQETVQELRSLASNVDFLVQVVRQNSDKAAFKLLSGGGGDEDEEANNAGCCGGWHRINFL